MYLASTDDDDDDDDGLSNEMERKQEEAHKK